MNAEELYDLFKKSTGISIDSRSLKGDNLFFGIKGDNFNGNKFALKALQNGAIKAIVDDESIKDKKNVIYVKDSQKSLQKLANYHRRKINIPLVAITGTNGKTTTKELISSVLSTQFNIGSTLGNLNNHIGVPLTLLSFNKKMDYGIVEMGANHKNEIKELCEIAEPNFGLITNIGKAHLEGFGSEEVLISTKKELYDYLYKTQGIVFLNNDNNLLKGICRSRVIYYGTSGDVLSKASLITLNPHICLKLNGLDKNIQTNLIGKYNFENILAAICVGEYFGVEKNNIKKALENYIPKNNRSQVVELNSNTIILDAYNANPSSMKLAIENFHEIDSNKEKVLFLGDMFELGSDSEIEHLKILEYIKSLNLKNVVLVGSAFFNLSKNFDFKFYSESVEFFKYLKEKNLKNKFILIKASRGMRLEKSIEYI